MASRGLVGHSLTDAIDRETTAAAKTHSLTMTWRTSSATSSLNEGIGCSTAIPFGIEGKRRLSGSSEIRVGGASGGAGSCGVGSCRVAEAAGDAAVEFDDAVDGFGAAVVGPAGDEVGQKLLAPGS